MGHSYAEMFPDEAEKRNRKWVRVNKLKKFLNGMPMSSFTVKELPALLNVMGLEKDHRGLDTEAYDENLEYFEKKFKLKKKGKVIRKSRS